MTRMREYRVEARGQQGERFLIITGSRPRALHFAGVFMTNSDYTVVSVEVDGGVWLGESIGRIP